MPKVLINNHSTFYDGRTKTQFDPVLNRISGCYVGIADVDAETADSYEGHSRFQVLTDEEYLAMVTTPRAPQPTEANTGDPLTDAAAKPARAKQVLAPPAPPKSN